MIGTAARHRMSRMSIATLLVVGLIGGACAGADSDSGSGSDAAESGQRSASAPTAGTLA